MKFRCNLIEFILEFERIFCICRAYAIFVLLIFIFANVIFITVKNMSQEEPPEGRISHDHIRQCIEYLTNQK